MSDENVPGYKAWQHIKILSALAVIVAIIGSAIARAEEPNSKSSFSLSDYLDWQQSYYSKMPFVQDAMRRWAPKEGGSMRSAMRGRHIEMMNFPTKICVQFSLTGPSVGGVPIYCYRVDRDLQSPHFELLEEYGEVE